MNVLRDAIWADAPSPATRDIVSVEITDASLADPLFRLPVPAMSENVEMTNSHGTGVVLEADSLEWFSPVQQRLIVDLCVRLTLDGVEANVRPTVARTSEVSMPSSIFIKLGTGAVFTLNSPWEKYGSAIVTTGRGTGVTVPVANDDAGEPLDVAASLVHRCIALSRTLADQEDVFALTLGRKRNPLSDQWENF